MDAGQKTDCTLLKKQGDVGYFMQILFSGFFVCLTDIVLQY